MKVLVLVGDGMADFPLEAIGGKTPLEVAAIPAMDRMAREGLLGLYWPIPDGYAPGSDIGNLSLFGYNPETTFTGRAPLEAARQGIELSPADVAFRCNLVTLEDGRMKEFTAGHISTEEAEQLIVALNDAFADDRVEFHTGVSYRHLAIVDAGVDVVDGMAALATTPPHDITDQEYAPHLPSGKGEDMIRHLMERSREVLDGHPVNRARIDAGKPPATSIWLWGQGRAPSLESYSDRFGLTGAVISAVDLIKGIGTCAGLEVIDVEGATGYLDTNYAGKVQAALDALSRVDFVYLHVEAPDETSHQGDIDLKKRAIEDFDRHVVQPCLDYAAHHPDLRMVAAPDHVTAISTKTHAGGPVPFVIWGAGVTGNGGLAYTEAAAQDAAVLVKCGYMLMRHIIQQSHLDADVLNLGPQVG